MQCLLVAHSCSVFAAFTAEMTAGALKLLCDVLISQDEKPQKTSLEPDDDMQPMTEEEKAQAKGVLSCVAFLVLCC